MVGVVGSSPIAPTNSEALKFRRLRISGLFSFQGEIIKTPMSFRSLLRSLLAVLALWLAGSLCTAQARDYITERAWLEDPGGQLSWSEVQHLPAQAFTGTLSRGYGSSVIWLRLRVSPAAHPAPVHEPASLVLRIRPAYLDDIRVYDPLAPGGLLGTVGDQHHPRLSELDGLDFLLPIARGEVPRDLWVRLASTSTRQIHVEALNVDELNRTTHRQALLFAGYIGLVLVFTIWAGVSWAFHRERVVGAFFLSQGNALIYALFSLGYLRFLWPAAWPAWPLDYGSSLFSIIAVSSAAAFHATLLREFTTPLLARRLLMTALVFLAVKLILFWGDALVIALQINLVEVLLSPTVFLVVVWRSRAWSAGSEHIPTLSRPLVLGFYLTLTALMTLAVLPGLGAVAGGEISLYVVQSHGLLTAFLMLLMLQYRAHLLNKRQREAAMALERSELKAQQEQKTREEQSKLLSMLAHEIKTPLSTMHMRLDPLSSSAPYIKQAIQDMNQVIERCMQTTRFNDGELNAELSRFDLVRLIRDAVSACPRPGDIKLSAPTTLLCASDRQLLFIVLSNLLENACKYGAPDAAIEVELRQDSPSGKLLIEVRNLPGQSGWPDTARLFEKYYRSPKAKRQSGTGLGLFLSQKLTRLLDGELLYQPDETWVRFVVDLPLAE